MTDSKTPDDDLRIEDLPPIEPPSAGFIVQLFIVPLLIVSVVFGVYVLFAKMASSEADWRQLVTDVRSENPHIRWRAALGLSQLLEADRQRELKAVDGPSAPPRTPLATNRDIATALGDLYGKLIQSTTPTEDETKQIEFLSKAIGLLDVDDVTIPVLRKGMSPDAIPEVRKHSSTGLAMIIGRKHELGAPTTDEELVQQILDMSREPSPLVRHQATYLLGLIASPTALDRARELLNDGNEITRINAAVALARNQSLDGMPTFLDLLHDAREWQLNPSQVVTQEEEQQYFERTLMLSNAITAIGRLKSQLSPQQHQEFIQALDQLTSHSEDKVLHSLATQLQLELQEQPN